MEKLIDSDCTVTQLWNPITLRNPEDGGDIFSETSVLTTASRYEVPEDIYQGGDYVYTKNDVRGPT
jgi:hypothetical protein